MKEEEIRQKREDEYATYKEYNDIFNISMNLNDENEYLQTQLTEANEKLEKIKKENAIIKKHNTHMIDIVREYINKYHFTPAKDYIELLNNLLAELEIIKGSDNK